MAAAKDIGAYAALESSPLQMHEMVTQHVPRDDESMAKYLAGQYGDIGLDPNLAYSGDEDPLADFGGKEAFH